MHGCLFLQETDENGSYKKLGGPLQDMEGLRMALMDVSNRSFNSDTDASLQSSVESPERPRNSKRCDDEMSTTLRTPFSATGAPNIPAAFTPEIDTFPGGLFDDFMLPEGDEELQEKAAKQISKNIQLVQQVARHLDQGKSVLESQVLDEMPNLSPGDGLEARAELSVRKAEKEVLEQKAQAEEEVRSVLLRVSLLLFESWVDNLFAGKKHENSGSRGQ